MNKHALLTDIRAHLLTFISVRFFFESSTTGRHGSLLSVARIRQNALFLLIFTLLVMFTAITPALAAPIYAKARLHGNLRYTDSTLPTGRQDFPFDVGGNNATTAQVNNGLPTARASGAISYLHVS